MYENFLELLQILKYHANITLAVKGHWQRDWRKLHSGFNRKDGALVLEVGRKRKQSR
jgi:hypothetical protein